MTQPSQDLFRQLMPATLTQPSRTQSHTRRVPLLLRVRLARRQNLGRYPHRQFRFDMKFNR